MKKFILILIIFVLAIIISVFLSFYLLCFNLKENLLDGLLGGLIGLSISSLAILIAWEELEAIKNTNSADFIHKLKNDFFKENTRILITLIDLEAIKFVKNENIVYFEVIEENPKLNSLPNDIRKQLTEKKFYTVHEIDDFLLGHFEDIGLFEQKGILDIEMVYEEFGWFIEIVFENCEIKKYIKYEREVDEDIYDKFEYIYHKSKSFGKCKLKNKNKFIWKLKWWIIRRLNIN